MKSQRRWRFFSVVLGSLTVSAAMFAAPRLGAGQQTPSADDSAASRSAIQAPGWATLVGSTESNKYHRPECGIVRRQIKPENVVWFADANDAAGNGYVAARCNDRKCRPPVPDAATTGEIGAAVLEPPSLTPPAIRKNGPPPRPARRTSTLAQTAIPDSTDPARELGARKKWDIWARWSLEQWCERWHVSGSGAIQRGTAYPPKEEMRLMERFKEMKAMIDDNQRRVTELEGAIRRKAKNR